MSTKVLSSVTLHKGRVFRLERDNVQLENGVNVDLDLIRHPGASAIVPLYETNTLILVKQYRHSVREFIWEIPAGTLDAHETPLECARRELEEETGFSSNTWNKLGEITLAPGYSDERIHIFTAANLMPARQNLDPDELLKVHKIPLKDAIDMIRGGQIQDAKTIAGLYMTHLLDGGR